MGKTLPELDRPGLRAAGTDRRALAAASATVLLWASAFVAIRSAGRHFDPAALALGRLLTGSAVLGVIWWLRGEGWPPRAAWPGAASTGVLWFGVYMIALNWGEQRVDAGTAAMVTGTGPLLVALLAGWLLGEGFPGRLIAGMAVSFAGVVLVGQSQAGGGARSVLGVGSCLLAAVCYAAAVTGQKPALRHASALQITTFGCLIGTALTLPFAGRLVHQIAGAPLPATLSVAYLGIFPTALAFTAWAYALARTTAGAAGPRSTSSRPSSWPCPGWPSARFRSRLPSSGASCAWAESPSPAGQANADLYRVLPAMTTF